MTTRPTNPYRKGSLAHAIMEGALEGEFDGKAGWEDMTAAEIAELFGKRRDSVTSTVSRIKRDTGYEVRYTRLSERKAVNK